MVPVKVSDQDREKVLAELHKRTIKYQEKIEKDKEEQKSIVSKSLYKCVNISHRPVSSAVKTVLSVREVWGSISLPVTSARFINSN